MWASSFEKSCSRTARLSARCGRQAAAAQDVEQMAWVWRGLSTQGRAGLRIIAGSGTAAVMVAGVSGGSSVFCEGESH